MKLTSAVVADELTAETADVASDGSADDTADVLPFEPTGGLTNSAATLGSAARRADNSLHSPRFHFEVSRRALAMDAIDVRKLKIQHFSVQPLHERFGQLCP